MSDLSLVVRDSSPITETRPRCPFYGFFLQPEMGVMVNQDGNQCALKTQSYSPCAMEIREQTPDWHRCPYNSGTITAAIQRDADSIRVFPKETPENGFSLTEWMQRF